MSERIAAAVLAAVLVAGCASAPVPPYPVYIRTADIPDAFVASMPGIRAKIFSGDPETRRSSSVLELPPGWQGTTGGFPDKSVELYVISGAVSLGGFDLDTGGYAFLPGGTTGLDLESDNGARVLYFLDNADDDAVIGTPLIADRDLMTWEASDDVADFGVAVKVLREDPGSGARTWLMRIQPGAVLPWRKSAVNTEGFLLEGHYRHAECVDGQPAPGEYLAGGYFSRPAEAIHGGPEAEALAPSVWYLRRLSAGEDRASVCTAAAAAPR